MKRVLLTFFLFCFFLVNSFGQAVADFEFNTACEGDSTMLISTSSVLPPDSITIYSWDLDGDFTFNDAIGPVITHYFGVPGNYDVGLKIYTAFGLMESVYRQVKVSDITADFSVANFCLGDVTQFTNLSDPVNCKIDKYEWSFGTTFLSNLENPTYVYPTIGSYNVSLTVFSDNGCQDTKYDIITIHEVPVISLSYLLDGEAAEPTAIIAGVPQFEFWRGQELTATLTIENDYEVINWSDGSHNTSLTIKESGNFTVDVITEFDCITSLAFNVTVKEDDRINPMPVITPNEDGINDEFRIKEYLHPDDDFTLKIYNRYGDEVYSNSRYMNDWKGTYEGKKLPDGSYYYYLEDKKRDKKVYKGAVNILTAN